MNNRYSIIIWLNPPYDKMENEEASTHHSGGRSHIFNRPAADRLAYGHYESSEEAEIAFKAIETLLSNNHPIRIQHSKEHGDSIFSIPASSIYYIAMAPA